MKFDYEITNLTKVSEIEIPEVFNRRIRTQVPVIDKIFGGEGILPGTSFTIAAAPGCGKTTLMLQICEQLALQGYSTGYVTGEESSVMVAYTCRRLGLSELQLCHGTDIDTICEKMKDLDFLIIDSFASLRDKGEKPKEEAAISRIVSTAKQFECAVGVILHFTKNGKYKGSTAIPHSVDCNMIIEVAEDSDNRNVYTTKNRYGCIYDGEMLFGPSGYDFEEVVDGVEYKTKSAQGKKSKMDMILDMKEPPHINVERVAQELQVAEAYARQMLYKLGKEGKLVKMGSGEGAIWKFPLKEVEHAV
jgi:DNA repair protein RadA/Sms